MAVTDGRQGYWHNWLSLSLGSAWEPECEWLVFDRDHVVAHPNPGFINTAKLLAPTYRRFEVLKHQLQQSDSRAWGQPDCVGLAWECDLAAMGPAGELLCIEVRHGSDALGICWAAAKVAAFAEACRASSFEFNAVQDRVKRLMALGLLPPTAWNQLPASGFSRILPVLVVAEPDENSPCWDRLEELAELEPAARVKVVRVQCGQSADQISLRR